MTEAGNNNGKQNKNDAQKETNPEEVIISSTPYWKI